MADRYWIGGSGNWDTSTTTNWSATSGGAGGASTPTATDDVHFDANSGFIGGSKTVTMTTSSATGRNIDWTGAPNTPSWTFSSAFSFTIHGSLTLITAMSFGASGTAMTIDAPTAATTYNLTFAGHQMGVGTSNFILSGSGNFKLLDALYVAGNVGIAGTFRPSNALDLNGQSVDVGAWQPQGNGGIDFNGATVNVRGGGTNTFTGSSTETSTTGRGALNFSNTSGCEWNASAGAATLTNIDVTISGSCTTWSGSTTFDGLTLTAGKTYTIPRSQTQTVSGTFTCNGTLGSLITINAGSGSQAANLCIGAQPPSSVSYTTFTNITASCSNIIDDGGGDGGGNNGIGFDFGGAPFGLLLEL